MKIERMKVVFGAVGDSDSASRFTASYVLLCFKGAKKGGGGGGKGGSMEECRLAGLDIHTSGTLIDSFSCTVGKHPRKVMTNS